MRMFTYICASLLIAGVLTACASGITAVVWFMGGELPDVYAIGISAILLGVIVHLAGRGDGE